MSRNLKISLIFIFLLISLLFLLPMLPEKELHASLNKSLLTEEILGNGTQLILPIPKNIALDKDKVRLGEQLYSDPLLSNNGFSCASCHPPQNAGIDGLKLSPTSNGGVDVMNTPTVFNAAFNSKQSWDGRHDSLEQQLDAVINNPEHMNSNWPLIISRLHEHEDYVEKFHQIYGSKPGKEQVVDVITSYERSMNTPDSDFDIYLRGNSEAITADQKSGYQLFQDYGCISCHQGINLGGNLFARFGIFDKDIPAYKEVTEYDLGRFNYTQKKNDKYVFRVPSLRNIAVTAPYFHDGSAKDLKTAIKTMARIQLDVTLPENEIALIEDFLTTLTGQYKGNKL